MSRHYPFLQTHLLIHTLPRSLLTQPLVSFLLGYISTSTQAESLKPLSCHHWYPFKFQ